MSFPKKFLGFPIGWKEQGEMGSVNTEKGYKYTSCAYCRTRAEVGIEKNEAFLYCPKCLAKLK